MAGEIQIPHTTALALYAEIRNAVAEIWNTVGLAFETYASLSITSYDVALAEQGTASGHYVGTFPPQIPVGIYYVTVFERAGASPAEGDAVVSGAAVHWNGTALVALGSIQAKTDSLTFGIANQVDCNVLSWANGGPSAAQVRANVIESGVLQGATASTAIISAVSSINPDSFRGCLLWIDDTSGRVGRIVSYNAGTQECTMERDWVLTPVVGDNYLIIANEDTSLKPTVAGRTLDVSATGEAGVDWANVGGKTTVNNLSDTTVKTATDIATQIGVAGDGLTAVQLADSEDVYHAEVGVTRDVANTRDEYTVPWFKNGVRITSGITVPTIQVVKRADGTDLVASIAMTQIGSTGAYKYDESTNRISAGEAVLALVTATIDGASRSFAKVISRDST